MAEQTLPLITRFAKFMNGERVTADKAVRWCRFEILSAANLVELRAGRNFVSDHAVKALIQAAAEISRRAD